jgi:hypothetical protein
MENTQQSVPPPTSPKPRDRTGIVGGTVLIVIGLLFLGDNFIPGFRFHDFWPLILVAIGIGLLVKSWKST